MVVVRGETASALTQKMGPEFGKVLSYKWVKLPGKYRVIVPSYYDMDESLLPTVEGGTKGEVFSAILNHVSDFTYLEHQADPNLLFTVGGNCQAVSLYLYEAFRKHGLDSGLIINDGIDHMSVWVEVDGYWAVVDMTRNYIDYFDPATDPVADGKTVDYWKGRVV